MSTSSSLRTSNSSYAPVDGDPGSEAYQSQQLNRKQTGAVGAATSAVRGILLQPLYLWYRTPLKLFRPLRVDYLATARALLPQEILSQRVSLRGSTLGMIANAVKQRGWSFVPRYVLQPMAANWTIGFALFTTYTAILPAAYAQASRQYFINSNEALPWYPPVLAGASAGLAQSIVATPLDSLRMRFEVEDMVSGRYRSWWAFASNHMSVVGLKGLYRGLRLTMSKDILGYAAFFGLFEMVKNETIDLYREMRRRLWKRQIDDVQFQLAQLDSMDEKKESVMLQAISNDNNASDVIKGVYEGGLKTWECSIDLLGYIVDNFEGLSAHLHGRRVLEIGCGTALPSLHILKSVPGVSVTMQDYNKDVLELITIPNVLCNTILEPSGDSTLGDKSHVDGDMETCEIHVDSRRMQMLFGKDADKIIGERDIPQLTDPEVQEADRKLLSRPSLATQCEFIGGGWEEMEKEMCRLGRQHTFELIVTSETIYETSTYKQLHDLLACMLAKPGADDSINGCSWPMVLVAAKSLYFGLTGSVLSFNKAKMEN
ncbi:hypothetical protein LPJ72_003135 [Coemansia sp. Benny D160-2]|nr:hypothetical protein LPJ72_003135 [Coemansia sp. Benny D160-2]